MTAIIITVVISALCGLSFGKASNGMTSPRQAFNIFTPAWGAFIGAVVGLIAGIGTASLSLIILHAVIGLVVSGASLALVRSFR